MSLIVARKVENEIYFIADTKFTDEEASASKQFFGGLKLVILAPGVCVGFAGDVSFAQHAIQGIYDKRINIFEKNVLLDYFLSHHLRSVVAQSETYFIIGTIVERTAQPGVYEKELFRIFDSQVSSIDATTFIGDTSAYACFQDIIHNKTSYTPMPTYEITSLGKDERPEFQGLLAGAQNAMQGVIDNPRILSVDGIRTIVLTANDEFRYAEFAQLRGHLIHVQKALPTCISFGSAEEGSSHWHAGIVAVPGISVWAIYSYSGKFGLIYSPTASFSPHVERNCSLEKFREVALEHSIATQQRLLSFQANC